MLEELDVMSLLPATAGPAPTLYGDANGEIVKVVLSMTSLDTDESWDLEIDSAGSRLCVRAVKSG